MEVLFVLLVCGFITNSLEDNGLVPQILSLQVQSDIQYRYARTVVSSRVANPANISREATFSMVLPETAFISGFFVEVDGEVYDAYVKEKDEAKKTYDEAVKEGKTAGHIALSARDSNRFTVSMNVEPKKEVKFNLLYEELLRRKLGTYKHVINLDPGQIVQDFGVIVGIEESDRIINLTVPEIRVRKEMDATPSTEMINSVANIKRPSRSSAVVKFMPNVLQQQAMAKDGIKGQLIVEYDVDRTSHEQQVLMSNGYFTHYFAPEDLNPMSKHVIFVLDISGSMTGRKIVQLKEAMNAILDDLRKGDYFNLISFSSNVEIWKHNENPGWIYANIDGDKLKNMVTPVNKQNIMLAKEAISKLDASGGTNIYNAMKTSTNIAQLGKQLKQASGGSVNPKPIIIFLTDGEPSTGEINLDKIIIDTTNWNRKSGASIFTLALGFSADLDFLKKLSLRNSGIAVKIYEASDTALQLRDFYRQVASPLIADVTFTYQPEQVESVSLTKHHFDSFYQGSELIVAGRLGQEASTQDFTYEVQGRTSEGTKQFQSEKPVVIIDRGLGNPPSFMEKLWAYLKIQQLLDEEKITYGKTSEEKKREALKLALKYSFVTPVTSLVVVRPSTTDTRANIEPADRESWRDISRDGSGYDGQFHGSSTTIKVNIILIFSHFLCNLY